MTTHAPRHDQSSRAPRKPTVTVEELHQRLADAVAAIETGEQWQAWLAFAQRLHKYSFNNVILIWSQRPDASAVASYQTWQSLHRQVRRGEKAIRVLAPILRKTPIFDNDGRPVERLDGTREHQQRVVGFRPVPVFDIAQTDGPPLPTTPQPAILDGHAPPGLWEGLVGEVSQRGYRLMRGPVARLDGANGLTKISEREVWIRDDVDDAHAVKTLAHELAHVILHADPAEPADAGDCRGIREVEAESVAHLVVSAHGIDTGSYSFPYVASWAYPIAAVEHQPLTEIVTRTGSRVIQTAHEILDALPAPDTDPAGEALTARLTATHTATRELREQYTAGQLPPVRRSTLLGVVADSHDFFRQQVDRSWVQDYLAGRYLHHAVRRYEIGYAPGGWTTLTDHLRFLGYTDDHIEAAGMATRAKTGRLIDRFRDRLTIPLRDQHGDLVGFTARIAPDVTDPRTPKYLNNPTTAIFRKHEILYGLTEHAQQLASGAPLVLCEGPLDAIAIDTTGRDVRGDWVGVATIGTATTDQHAHQLLASTKSTIYLAFDADSAGRAAVEVAWTKLTQTGPRDIRVVELPDGQDPAEIAVHRSSRLRELIRDAKPAATLIANWEIDDARLDDHFGRRVGAFRSLCHMARWLPVEQRDGFIRDLAAKVNFDYLEAKALAAQVNPGVIMDQIATRAQQLTAAMTDHPISRQADDNASTLVAADRAGIPAITTH